MVRTHGKFSPNCETTTQRLLNRLNSSRGVVARGLTDGGNQERTLSEKYKAMSDAVRAKWPRTAAMLRSLSASYEQYARHEDISSDLLDLRLG
jgi:hypothetical protein